MLVGKRVVEVLPALQTLFLDKGSPSGPVPENIAQFVARETNLLVTLLPFRTGHVTFIRS